MGIIQDYVRLLINLLPRGSIWNIGVESNFKKQLEGSAVELARVHTRADDLINEVDPRTTVELINEWETVAGLPDPCIESSQTVQQRRLAIVEKLTNVASLSPSYYIEVARALGYEITITEFNAFRVGRSTMGHALNGKDFEYTWRVNAPETTVNVFKVGQSSTGEALQSFGNEILECAINRIKPAHTFVLFGFNNTTIEEVNNA